MKQQARSLLRRDALLAAATDVFLERGYESATLDEVIARAGGSRATIYQEFGDKQGLFAAIIAGVCDDIIQPLKDVGDAASIQATLHQFGLAYVSTLMQPKNLGLYRLMIGAGPRIPSLARKVFDAGPQAAAQQLARTLQRVRSPTRADRDARLFLEMVKGDLHTRALFGIDLPGKREIERNVRAAVAIFCAGIGA
jgi:TetR/AcrR family transcriptional repressor of mexJK operon